MLDPNAITQLVEQEIRSVVKSQVDQAVSQEEWIRDLENQIVEFVQARIVAKFSNISTVPDLVQTVEGSVQKLFADGFVPDIDHLIDTNLLTQAVDQAVENLVSTTIENLMLDSRWIDKVQTLVTQKMSEKLFRSLRDIDLTQKLESIILENKEILIKDLRNNFSSTGIVDNASITQLTVMDNVVVVEEELACNNATIVKDTSIGGDLTVSGDLAIKGRINTDSPNWNELADRIGRQTYSQIKDDFSHDLVTDLLEETKRGIDFNNVQINGQPLLRNGELASSVKASSLTRVGKLDNLRVKGRLGINTDNPDTALTIWDEEINLGIGKQKDNTAYIGTNKKQALNIGVNQQNTIEINSDGDLWVKNLQIGRNRIGHSTQAPGHDGAKGDIIFNINYKKGAPFAWICLGAYRWAELKT